MKLQDSLEEQTEATTDDATPIAVGVEDTSPANQEETEHDDRDEDEEDEEYEEDDCDGSYYDQTDFDDRDD